MKIEPIVIEVEVRLEPEKAFEWFVDRFASWWPKEYTWSGAALETIAIEATPDGKCYEVGPFGFRCDWGRVIEVERPRKIVFTWQIGFNREPIPDPAQASEIAVMLEPSAEGTRVRLEHSGFERHREGATYREMLASDQGWPWVMSRYTKACR